MTLIIISELLFELEDKIVKCYISLIIILNGL